MSASRWSFVREAADQQDEFFAMPLLVFLMVAEEMRTQNLLDLIGGDPLLAFRFFGRPLPSGTAAEKTVEEFDIAPVADVMLLLLEREFGITANEAYIETLQQFRETLASDFRAWRTTGAGKTVAGVTEMFDRLFFQPKSEPDGRRLIVPPLVFSGTRANPEWRSYISHVTALNVDNWRPFAWRHVPAAISGGPRIYAMERNVIKSIQLPDAASQGYILLLDDASMDSASVDIRRYSYVASIYGKKRTDAGAQATVIGKTRVAYHDAVGQTSVQNASAEVVYADYETIVAFDYLHTGFSVSYRCVPRSFAGLTRSVPGQAWVEAGGCRHMCTRRLDRISSESPFSCAVVWEDKDQNLHVTVIEARPSGKLHVKVSFKMAAVAGLGTKYSSAVAASGSGDTLSLYEQSPRTYNLAFALVLDLGTGAVTRESWKAADLPGLRFVERTFPRADGRRPYIGTLTIEQLPSATTETLETAT